MKSIDEFIKKIVNEKDWKPVALTGAVLLIIAALLQSGLVTIILALLQLLFTLGGLLLLAYAVYLAWPVLVKKYKSK